MNIASLCSDPLLVTLLLVASKPFPSCQKLHYTIYYSPITMSSEKSYVGGTKGSVFGVYLDRLYYL